MIVTQNHMQDTRKYARKPFTKRNNKTWKDIGNYIVYSDGRVFSKRRGLFLINSIDGDGYFWLRAPKAIKLHRLLAICFIPNPKELPVINHKDGNKQNNNLKNLEWCTVKHNCQHAVKIGLHKPMFGIKNPAAKLKYLDLLIIREALQKGFSGYSISKYYKVDKATIYRIKNGLTWRSAA